MKPGEMLGPYRVVSELGAGGMGQVYRARDTKLDREVAIKILPESFSADPDRLMRFEREAKALASLNHPNIAQIYGLEGDGPVAPTGEDRPPGSRPPIAIVMELVEGEDLSERMARGAMALDDALPIVRQVADALEAAHAQGIVHRDLKPANIKVRADGVVKVLDFGLAKAVEGDGSGLRRQDASPSSMESPTMTSPAMPFGDGSGHPEQSRGMTEMGMILGTAAYMAPEQARGRPVDHRADIWAFGVVLAEMLTGRHAFKGEDITETLAAVVKSPPNLDGLAPDTPEAVRRLLRRCLEKDPRKRLSSIADARLELDDAATADANAPDSFRVSVARPSLFARLWPALAGVAVALAAVAAFSPWDPSTVADGVTRTTILAPPGTTIAPDAFQAAISPDGTMVVMAVGGVSGGTELWLRSLDSPTPRRLDVGGANLPFWKPDSSRIGFFGFDGKLKAVAVTGGRAEELCDVANGRGAAWSVSDDIVFAPDSSGPLSRVPAAGGACEPVTRLDATRKQDGHRLPAMLPDGEHFLYAATPGRRGNFDVFVGSLTDDSVTFVDSFESAPAFAEPGWLLFARQGGLAAQRFDVDTLSVSGTVVSLADEPTREWNPIASLTAAPVVSVSTTGSLVYTSAPPTNTTAIWHDPQGRPTGTFDLPPGRYSLVSVDPDGVQAVFVRSESVSESTLWLADLSTRDVRPLLTGPGRNDAPVWSPESDRVAYSSNRDGPSNIYVIGTRDPAEERLLHESDVSFRAPSSWSSGPGGEWIVVTQQDPEVNIWLLSPASGDMKPYLQRPFIEGSGVVDPTGRWIAYMSFESGSPELYLQSFPEPGQRVQATRQGAFFPALLEEDRLLFPALDRQSMWEVDLGSGTTPRPGAARQLATFPEGTIWIEPLPDGRFLSIVPESTDDVTVTLVRNWLRTLPAR